MLGIYSKNTGHHEKIEARMSGALHNTIQCFIESQESFTVESKKSIGTKAVSTMSDGLWVIFLTDLFMYNGGLGMSV